MHDPEQVPLPSDDTTTKPPEPVTAGDDATTSDATLAQVRELLARAYPDVVPELLQGATVEELLASLPAAQAAFAGAAARLRQQAGVPSGASVRSSEAAALERLSPAQKIRQALRSA